VGYVFIGNDLTDFHQAMAEIQNYNERLETSNRALESFAYAVSHDLKEPLRTINGFVTLLSRRIEREEEPETQEYLYFINQGIVRMNALIDSILTISRLGSEQEDDEPVSLERVVLEVKDKLRGLCSQKNATIHYEEPLPDLRGKYHQLSLLFQNLIENGIKYNKSTEPLVKVGCRLVPQGYQFSIADNGIGIAPKYHEQVFQMFKRLHSWAEYEGTGIGLTMCRKIVEGLGGRIWIESSPEARGTTFKFIIPEQRLLHSFSEEARAAR
jgi:light-regulated signal transduction histidine kinase (bacteriophytochrome)